MKNIHILDRYTNKYILIHDIKEDDLKSLKPGDKVVYEGEENNKKKLSIGTYLGHPTETDREGYFMRKLEGEEKTYFDDKQKEAGEKFPTFKKEFKSRFEGSIPVTARYQIFSRQIYFYFYSEQRYQFGDFVKSFQDQIGSSIFFFQVGARDMIKMSPATDDIVGCNGQHLCCKSSRPLPSVDIENVLIQHLEGRDIERLKGRCGKLKCSIIYELETYISESEKYPVKGQRVEAPACDTCGVCTSFNINTGEVVIKSDDASIMRLPISEIKRTLQEKQKLLTQERKPKEAIDNN